MIKKIAISALYNLCQIPRGIWALILLCSCFSNHALVLEAESESWVLAPHSTFYIDTTAQLGFNDIVKPELQQQFQHDQREFLNFGIIDDAVWIHIPLTLSAQANQPVDLLLEIAASHLDQVDLYFANNDEVISLGAARPWSQRPIEYHNFLIPLRFNSGEHKDLYLRVKNQGSLQVPLILWRHHGFYQNYRVYAGVMGTFYAAVVIMLIYNFFNWRLRNETAYPLYLGFILSFGLYITYVQGHGYEWFWPQLPWLQKNMYAFAASLAMLFSLALAKKVLHVHLLSNTIQRALNGLMLCSVAIAASVFIIPKPVLIYITSVTASLVCIATAYAGVSAWRQGIEQARFYLYVWSSLLITILALVFATFGLVESSFTIQNILLIGASLQMVIWAIALSLHFNTLVEASSNDLSEHNQRLRESNALKDNFLHSISHELRTPINGIQGAMILAKEAPNFAVAKQEIISAQSSTNNLINVVEDVIAYTECLASNMVLNKQKIVLRAWITQLFHQALNENATQGHNHQLDIDPTLAVNYYGDIEKISTVLRHLLSNAFKFSSQGLVKLSIKPDSNYSGRIVFCISDTGAGISEQRLDRIFEQLAQLDNNSEKQYEGLGIGLTLCQHLSNTLGGDLYCESILGTGSRFYFSLPLQLPPQDSDNDVSLIAQPHLKDKVLALVVEDNPINQMVLKGLLSKLNYHVESVDNGQQAVDWLLKNTADVVLMDCQMPIMDGFEATEKIRQLDNPMRDVPIIAITANALSTDRAKCLEVGMNGYLKKPINKQKLQEGLVSC